MRVLVVNAGSSSLKLSVLDEEDHVETASERSGRERADPGAAVAELLEGVAPPAAVGHRVVHGGPSDRGPLLLDPGSEDRLEALSDLAPLHNPPSLAAVTAVRALLPGVPQVACFDTSFHAGLPPKAATYALPAQWRDRWSLRRYGFHGLSHDWASRRTAQLLGRGLDGLRLVTAHLGAGASLAAVADGWSVDTTMGFTPLEGLVMATRSGSVDPGLVLWVQRHGGLSAGEVEAALEHESGLRGLWGRSGGDLRVVLEGVDAGDVEAGVAYDVYVYRIQREVGAMVTAMGGLDGLAFTGGAGESSARLRQDVCRGLALFGLRVDPSLDAAVDGDAVVSVEGATPVAVVRCREDIVIARQVRALLG